MFPGLCGVRHYHNVVPDSIEERKPIHSLYLNSGDRRLEIPETDALLVTTIALVAKCRNGQPVIPSRWARFLLIDEGQSAECEELLCVPHVLEDKNGFMTVLCDERQIQPREAPIMRESWMGHLRRQSYGLVWSLPFEREQVLPVVLHAWHTELTANDTFPDEPPNYDDDERVLMLSLIHI